MPGAESRPWYNTIGVVVGVRLLSVFCWPHRTTADLADAAGGSISGPLASAVVCYAGGRRPLNQRVAGSTPARPIRKSKTLHG
jgi:hypothetical protein